MAGDSMISVTEGSGKNIATYQRSVSSNTVEDQRFVLSEPFLAGYSIAHATAAAVSTANSHLIAVMAGPLNRVAIRRIRMYQVANANVATNMRIQILRLTAAGSGGTACNVTVNDPTDTASGVTAQTLPSSKGTEGSFLAGQHQVTLLTSAPTAVHQPILDLRWDDGRTKPPIIAAGTSNGFCVKNLDTDTTATVRFWIEFSEVFWS